MPGPFHRAAAGVLTAAWLLCGLPAKAEDPTAGSLPPGPRVGFGLGLGAGFVSYQEQFSGDARNSDWDAGFGSLHGTFRAEYRGGWVLQGRGVLWTSAEEEEEWSEAGVLVQRNDTSIRGADLLYELGYKAYEARNVRIAPFAGLGLGVQRFERRNFDNLLYPSDDPGVVREDVSAIYFNGALEWSQRVTPGLEACGRVDLGFVVANAAENSYFDERIEGDGGVIVALRGGFRWEPAPRHALAFLLSYQQQNLEGGVEYIPVLTDAGVLGLPLEWPDNDLDRLEVDLEWTYTF